MRAPWSWLRDYVRVDASPEEVGDRLSMTGTKLEAVHRRGVPGGDGSGLFRVGRVVEAGRHPNADRLTLCSVDVGDPEPRQIVCGATNFRAGDTVAVALPGATLPDGTQLRRARLRGVESDGMMLSERELELSGEHAGILTLPPTWPVGAPLSEYLPLSDTVLDFEITSNRPDCLSVYGLAREVSAAYDAELAPPPGVDPTATGPGTVVDHVRARVEAPDLCPRWAGRVFTDVRVGPSPPWLKARITAAGMRPISNVVDITNYVMLALGEPTHAFDLDLVAGREIVVRRAGEGEEIVTLDGQRRVLDPSILVIADAEKPSAIAGLMGSEWSEVSDATTTVLLECANFASGPTQAASLRLGLRTEGSSRWEKGVDPHVVPQALALASELLVSLCGARLVPGTVDVHGELPERPVVPLRVSRLNALIGARYVESELRRILGRLGYEQADGGWRVPTWRAQDTTREVDLIEEVARVAGLERVEARLPARAKAVGGLTREQRLRRELAAALVGAGLTEAFTQTFTDPGVFDRLRLPAGDERRRAVRLRNPLGADQALMRTLILPGLADSARRNLAVGAGAVGLFEVGTVYGDRGAGERPAERQHVCGLVAGEGAGFLALKGVLDAAQRALGAEPAPVAAADEPFLHPGRAARVGELGWIGELHPQAAAELGIEAAAVAFELDLVALLARAPARRLYRDVPPFPPLRQDIAVAVDDGVPAGEVVAAALGAGAPVVARVELFDVYRGAQVGEGRKSLAFHLVMQAPDRTLTDAEAAPVRERIVAELERRFGAELRSA